MRAPPESPARQNDVFDVTTPDDELRRALTDPACSDRVTAVRLAGERRLRDAYAHLDALVDDADPDVRCAAIVALAKLGDAACVPLLRAHLEIDLERRPGDVAGTGEAFRLALIWALGQLGDRTAVDALDDAASRGGRCGTAARAALDRLTGTDAHPAWETVRVDTSGPARSVDRKGERLAKWVTGAARSLSAPYVVLHTGARPDDQAVRCLLGTMTTSPDQVPVDICISDDGSDPSFTSMWRQLARRGLRTTIAAPGHVPFHGPLVVLHRLSIDVEPVRRARPAWQRPSWWAATMIVVAMAIIEVRRILSGVWMPGVDERRWLAAAEAAGAGAPQGDLPGSTLWPTLVRPLLNTAGTTGVRLFSLAMTLVAIGCSAAAASRLFGRWAARLTAVVLAVAMVGLDTTSSATPVPTAMAAIAVSLLGTALVECHERRSWVLMAGISAVLAVIVYYPSVVLVAVVGCFFALLSGRQASVDSIAFRLVVVGGALAWFLPTRAASTAFITADRSARWWGDVAVRTAGFALAYAAVCLLVWFLVGTSAVRRRVLVLSLALIALPATAALAGGPGGDRAALCLTLVLLGPVLAAVVAFRVAVWRYGHAVAPALRVRPELLVVDAEAGRLHGRLVRYPNWQIRLVAPLLILSAAWYLPWAATHIAMRNWWLAVPFIAANTFMVASTLLSVFNNWTRAVPVPMEVARGHEPLVGVIVPTCGEPIHMVCETVRSIIDQDWPVERLRVVVSDDGHDDTLQSRIGEIARLHPSGTISYHRPPRRGEPTRRGDSKSGNLNSAIGVLDAHDCDVIETRDADDLVGSSGFLRSTVAHLMDDPGLGFIQTVKRTRTSPGDPFNNNEPFFYRGTMLARNADSAIFPCGSGLVWRRSALASIDDFPVWNLVEDLHSGVLGLRGGWRGLYVPIVGAVAQHSPEDVANAFKQRGTWALDTTRLFVFDRFSGIGWKARLHFVEQALFYLQSFALLTLLAVPAISLTFGRFPLVTDPVTYAVRFWGFALAIELALLAMAADQPTGSLWRSRLSWVGMSPVYARAALRAVRFGPRRKPAYKVTRKTDAHQVYVRLVIAHWVLAATLLTGMVAAVVRDGVGEQLDLGSMYWSVVGLVGLGAFLRLSWFGVDLRERIATSSAYERLARVRTARRSRVQSAA